MGSAVLRARLGRNPPRTHGGHQRGLVGLGEVLAPAARDPLAQEAVVACAGVGLHRAEAERRLDRLAVAPQPRLRLGAEQRLVRALG